MKRIALLAIMPLFFLASKGPGTGTSGDILPYPIHQHRLSNGLNVVTVPYPSPGIATFHIVVRVGSREEVEPGKTGFAHFFEHVMFRGSKNFTKEKYNEVLKSMGASANANTWLDRTIYHMTGNAEKIEKMFEIEADRFLNLSYSEGDFKVEAGAVKGEYTKNFTSQFEQLDEALSKTAFDKHTYQHTTMGFLEDIVEMPNQYQYSLGFYDRFYRPEYTTIVVVGDVTPEAVNALAEKYFGHWQNGNHVPNIPVEPAQTETRHAHIQNADFIPTVAIAFKSPAFSDVSKDAAVFDLISTMLFSSRSELYKKLVIQEQKLLSLFAFNLMTRDPYLFQVTALLKDEKDMEYVRDEILKAFYSLKSGSPDAELVKETMSYKKYNVAMELDNPDNIADYLTYFTWVSGRPESMNSYYRMMETISPLDIVDVANRYFIPNTLTIGTISSTPSGFGD